MTAAAHTPPRRNRGQASGAEGNERRNTVEAKQRSLNDMDEAEKHLYRTIAQALDVRQALRQKSDADIGELLMRVWAEADLFTVQSGIISEAIDRLQRTQDHLYFNGHWVLTKDEGTGEVYWRGGGVDDKDESRFNPSEPLIADPKHFEVGYTIIGYAPLVPVDSDEGAEAGRDE